MARLLIGRGVEATFHVVGPDEGDLPAVKACVDSPALAGRLVYEGPLPYDAVLARMAKADVYVLPAVDEPFPMSLLEALSLGLPTVCTTGVGISNVLASSGASCVTDPGALALADAVAAVLADAGRRQDLRDAALRVTRDVFGIGSVADRLEALYLAAQVEHRLSGALSAKADAESDTARLEANRDRRNRTARGSIDQRVPVQCPRVQIYTDRGTAGQAGCGPACAENH